jgi:uncharacterized protein YggL (DUF469 family)
MTPSSHPLVDAMVDALPAAARQPKIGARQPLQPASNLDSGFRRVLAPVDAVDAVDATVDAVVDAVVDATVALPATYHNRRCYRGRGCLRWRCGICSSERPRAPVHLERRHPPPEVDAFLYEGPGQARCRWKPKIDGWRDHQAPGRLGEDADRRTKCCLERAGVGHLNFVPTIGCVIAGGLTGWVAGRPEWTSGGVHSWEFNLLQFRCRPYAGRRTKEQILIGFLRRKKTTTIEWWRPS